jgi:hypothetical protein
VISDFVEARLPLRAEAVVSSGYLDLEAYY